MNLHDQTDLQFEKMKHLDSRAFIEIPQKEIIRPFEYQRWLVNRVEMQWMKAFNTGNAHYYPHYDFNTESGINGNIGGTYIIHCKLYRYDGTEVAVSEEDYRASRGYLIRDHYTERDVVKVQLIADNLVEFLMQEQIEHKRINFSKRI